MSDMVYAFGMHTALGPKYRLVTLMSPLVLTLNGQNRGQAPGTTLTRPKAKDLLVAAGFNRVNPYTVNLVLNQIIRFRPADFQIAQGGKNAYLVDEAMITEFKSLGLVTQRPITDDDIKPLLGVKIRKRVTDAGSPSNPDDMREWAKLRLPFGVAIFTPEGIKESAKWQCQEIVGDSGLRLNMEYLKCVVPTTSASAELQVTGISGIGTEAAVEFRRRMIPNRIGEQLLKDKLTLNTAFELRNQSGQFSVENVNSTTTGLDTGSASFRLYDDGWRVIRN